MDAREFLRSLLPGDDRELAVRQYAGRESATDEAARKQRMAYGLLLAKTTNGPRRAGGGA
ncbi:hypothetical protein HLK59_38070 [Streptomyces sp. S3(2020)]|uniref:hypothetical protein n=1 Tax=Streptomyces sp. S3(2020) TaxID=2732044 RepID=UPI00148A05B4|nr:hypothetical protein [Streptomyces sp. S3(2020)]NNN36071.1 hypothetical protein [Streptomyces sp. S3(2020)]